MTAPAWSADAAERALSQGRWVKLICGASNQDLPAIADLCAVYAMAGVHCVDVAADPAVVHAAREGLAWAHERQAHRPWLMVSISDGQDPHFRKAFFVPERCPPDCSRPCERVCPALAISPGAGVAPSLCYGCGRCLPACPLGLIETREHRIGRDGLTDLLRELRPDALEIHTAPGRAEAFEATLAAIGAATVPLRRLAVSCGLEGHQCTVADLSRELWSRHAALRARAQRPLWQLDGRPMRGDVGAGTARAAVRLWNQLRPLAPPGPLQLAGGTNAATIDLLPNSPEGGPAGVAFGGMARALLQPLLQEAERRGQRLRDWPEGWSIALQRARALIRPWLQRPLGAKAC